MKNQNRKQFIRNSLILGVGIPFWTACNLSKTEQEIQKKSVSEADQYVFDPIPMDAVREYVLYAHSDFDRMKSYIEKYPHIINATVDWGDGDFETAIGATGHMGNKEFAKYLISQGARMDLFVMSMLGMTDVVLGILKQYPNLLNSIGPHGFTLLHHAEIGGKEAEDIYAYLIENGLKEKMIQTFKKE